ncbi:MAG: amino acid ABC transporter substrate-binding protein [Syntrophomonadaceae bacterium]|nr:amino acid ABC transporter substrate-binding protein [Syntrophomonadaceae bacterium]
MKKRLALILLLCFSLTMLVTGCTGQPAQTPQNGTQEQTQQPADKSFQTIKDQGYFTLGLDDAFPPMGFREEGTNDIVGFDIDMAKEAAKRMGVDVKFQPVIWDVALEELNNGKVDVVWNGMTITPARQEKIAFTEPYITDKQIIVVQKGSTLADKKALAGKKVGIQAASSAIEAVEKDKATFDSLGELVQFDNNVDALLDLKSGRIDAVVVDEVVGRYYLAKHVEDYQVLTENFGEESFGVGLRKSDVTFLAELQKALDAMKADGTSKQISEKWFGEDLIN